MLKLRKVRGKNFEKKIGGLMSRTRYVVDNYSFLFLFEKTRILSSSSSFIYQFFFHLFLFDFEKFANKLYLEGGPQNLRLG